MQIDKQQTIQIEAQYSLRHHTELSCLLRAVLLCVRQARGGLYERVDPSCRRGRRRHEATVSLLIWASGNGADLLSTSWGESDREVGRGLSVRSIRNLLVSDPRKLFCVEEFEADPTDDVMQRCKESRRPRIECICFLGRLLYMWVFLLCLTFWDRALMYVSNDVAIHKRRRARKENRAGRRREHYVGLEMIECSMLDRWQEHETTREQQRGARTRFEAIRSEHCVMRNIYYLVRSVPCGCSLLLIVLVTSVFHIQACIYVLVPHVS